MTWKSSCERYFVMGTCFAFFVFLGYLSLFANDFFVLGLRMKSTHQFARNGASIAHPVSMQNGFCWLVQKLLIHYANTGIYHSTSDRSEVLLKRPLFRGIFLIFHRAATHSKSVFWTFSSEFTEIFRTGFL